MLRPSAVPGRGAGTARPGAERREFPRVRSRSRATVRPSGQFLGWGAFAALVDVSLGGAHFLTPIPHENGQAITVELEPNDGGPPLRVEAVVRWALPARKRGWTAVGCSWRLRLSHDDLRRLI